MSLITSPVIHGNLYNLFIVGEKEKPENKTLVEVCLPSAVHSIFIVVSVLCYAVGERKFTNLKLCHVSSDQLAFHLFQRHKSKYGYRTKETWVTTEVRFVPQRFRGNLSPIKHNLSVIYTLKLIITWLVNNHLSSISRLSIIMTEDCYFIFSNQ